MTTVAGPLFSVRPLFSVGHWPRNLHVTCYNIIHACSVLRGKVLLVTTPVFAGTPVRALWERLDSYLAVLSSEDSETLRAEIAALLSDVRPADGRMARSHQTRRAIVDAMRALHAEGDLRPTAPRVAARAGVSLRTVWQHFADMEALLLEAGRRDLEILLQIVRPIAPDLPFADRVEMLADQRARVHEQMTPGWRASRIQQPFSRELRLSKRRMTALARAELEAVFATELGKFPAGQRQALADALHGVTIWAFWDSLRCDVGLNPDQARETIAGTVLALFAKAGITG
jgi:TetR/AcrR family transcriptional regulator, regulator of autoinduction and epiphytic fitness